jgi:hypothetical protein
MKDKFKRQAKDNLLKKTSIMERFSLTAKISVLDEKTEIQKMRKIVIIYSDISLFFNFLREHRLMAR